MTCSCLPSDHHSPLLRSATNATLSSTEIQFSPQCAQLWLETHHQVTVQCTFLLMRFPFENVRCVLELKLQDGQLWDLQNLNVTVPTFNHLSYLITHAGYEPHDSVLTVALLFRRQYSGYVVTTFIPILLLVTIAFLTFFFHRDDFTNRVMVTLSVLIVLASLFSQTAANLPQTSYVKCIDLVFLFAIFLISLVIVCHVFLSLVDRHTAHAVIKVSPGVPNKPHRWFRSMTLGNRAALAVCCCAVITGVPTIVIQCHD
ncbi:Ligand-gated ion channel 50 [Portunus trituberculatus]|uniref:Ligand-gated ion channel 50 n=1 Tax=Portunus trituberculatus TaxID=210409 RepID=A0A5B7INV5_PORTR|nr:Ligand-gated ion channel 50 [Portunus trituberculatus]